MFESEGCREELLEIITALVKEKGKNEFTLTEAVEAMANNHSVYSENTIRTHISSRCCVNAPKHHETTYDDYERVGRGVYRIKDFSFSN